VLENFFIRKRKRPDGSGFWGAYLIGEDELGTWLFTPRGSLYRAEAEGRVAFCCVGKPDAPGMPVMHLVAPGAWWIAMFRPADEVQELVSIDIALPPRLARSVWEYFDLELDVWVAHDREIHIQDQDEFDEACRLGHITPAEADGARAATDRIVADLKDPARTLVDAGVSRLRSAMTMDFPPIRDLPGQG